MVSPERAEQFKVLWSDLPKSEQQGRKAFVTTYQFHMWHTLGLEVQRFWVLQGPTGGTAAQYNVRERRYLDGAGALSEPIPMGFFPACPFDERSVNAILERDRLLKYGGNVDALEKADRPEALQAEDEAAERVFRDRWLDWWFEQTAPQAEFLKSYLSKSESDQTMRKATKEENDSLAHWKDDWREHGSITGAGMASSRKIQVAVR